MPVQYPPRSTTMSRGALARSPSRARLNRQLRRLPPACCSSLFRFAREAAESLILRVDLQAANNKCFFAD